MVLRSETPPPPADLTVDTPPDAPRPTTAMLKADIDSGRTGDKVAHLDVGLSPLGTDDEAAGAPPSPEAVALAREAEAATAATRAHNDPHGRSAMARVGYVGVIVLIALIVGGALWLAR